MSALIPDNAAAPGYCSVATVPLTTDQIARIQQAATTGFAPGITLFFKKHLVGKGTRRLLLVDDDVAIMEDAGKRKSKFISKDAVRFEAMVGDVVDDGGGTPRLSAEDSGERDALRPRVRRAVAAAIDGDNGAPWRDHGLGVLGCSSSALTRSASQGRGGACHVLRVLESSSSALFDP